MKEKYAMISGTFIGGDTNAHCIYRKNCLYQQYVQPMLQTKQHWEFWIITTVQVYPMQQGSLKYIILVLQFDSPPYWSVNYLYIY